MNDETPIEEEVQKAIDKIVRRRATEEGPTYNEALLAFAKMKLDAPKETIERVKKIIDIFFPHNKGITGKEWRRWAMMNFLIDNHGCPHDVSYISKETTLTLKEAVRSLKEFVKEGFVKDDTDNFGAATYEMALNIK